VSENRMLRKTHECKRQLTGSWRKLCNKEPDGLYSLANIGVIKSRKIRWVELVSHVGETHAGFWLENLKELTTWET